MTNHQDASTFLRVGQLNEMFDNSPFVGGVDWMRLEKQCASIEDEIREARDAAIESDFDEVRDGLCDVRVFACGAEYFLGLDYAERALGAGMNPIRVDPSNPSFGQILDFYLPELDRLFSDVLMPAIAARDLDSVIDALQHINTTAFLAQVHLGVDPQEDMHNAIDGVMTRSCEDQADLQATLDFWENEKGLEVYVVGEFPNKAVKSAKDQPDAPQGKFLKSASTRKPVYRQYT